MKTNENTRILEFGLIVLVTVILFTGCSGLYQSYHGTLPPEQVSIIKVATLTRPDGYEDNTILWPSTIDGKSAPLGCTLMKLLPGEHTISFNCRAEAGFYSLQSKAPVYTTVHLEAGKIYEAVPHLHSDLTWQVEISPEIENAHYSRWRRVQASPGPLPPPAPWPPKP